MQTKLTRSSVRLEFRGGIIGARRVADRRFVRQEVQQVLGQRDDRGVVHPIHHTAPHPSCRQLDFIPDKQDGCLGRIRVAGRQPRRHRWMVHRGHLPDCVRNRNVNRHVDRNALHRIPDLLPGRGADRSRPLAARRRDSFRCLVRRQAVSSGGSNRGYFLPRD